VYTRQYTDSNLQNLKSQKPQDHDTGFSLSVTVHNIPKLPNENLQDVASKIMDGLGVPVEPGHIAHCRRIKPTNQQHNTNAPMIIIKFVSTYHKDLVWKKYIADKCLTVKDIFPDLNVDSRVYINLMLSPNKNRIKNEVMRRLIKPGLAQKLWINKGTIHVTNAKKPGESPVPVYSTDDIQALAESWTQ
jgi:hypothetical protein